MTKKKKTRRMDLDGVGVDRRSVTLRLRESIAVVIDRMVAKSGASFSLELHRLLVTHPEIARHIPASEKMED